MPKQTLEKGQGRYIVVSFPPVGPPGREAIGARSGAVGLRVLDWRWGSRKHRRGRKIGYVMELAEDRRPPAHGTLK